MEGLISTLYDYKETVFIITLSVIIGFEVISKVPSVLHTPLMSGANAISGVSIIGGIILLGHANLSGFSLNLILGVLAVFFGSLNVAGGFVVTDRMLEMFKKKKKKHSPSASSTIK